MRVQARTLAFLLAVLGLGCLAALLARNPPRERGRPAPVPDAAGATAVEARADSAEASRAPATPAASQDPLPPRAAELARAARALRSDREEVRLAVTGTVVDERGAALEGAELFVGDPWEGEALVARSDATGALRGELLQRPRSFAFTVLATDREGARRSLSDPRGDELRLGTITLGPGGEVRGRVVDESGRGLERAWLQWLPAAAFPADVEQARENGPEESDYDESRFHALTMSGPDGRFRLRGLPPGECFLSAGADARCFGWTPLFEVRPGPLPEQEIVLLPSATAGLSIAGVVQDPAGRPLAGMTVRCRDGKESWDWTESGPDGRFLIDHGRRTPIELGAYDREQRYAPTWVAGIPPGTQDLVLRLGEPVWLAVRLLDGEGRGVPWGHVRFENRLHDGGKEGRLHIQRPSEPFLLQVTAPGFRSETLGPLEPPPRGEELRLVLEPGQCLRGRVLQRGRPVSGARLDLAQTWAAGELREGRGIAPSDHPFVLTGSVELGGDDGTSDATGAFVLTIHSDGWQGLRVEAEGFPTTVFGPYELKRSAVVDDLVLELERGGALEGSVRTAPSREQDERLVAVASGWGFVRTGPVDAEGRYKIEGLAPGPYQVRPCVPPVASLQRIETWSTATEPLVWDCHVRADETTRFDLDLTQEGSVVLAARLELAGVAPGDWNAYLMAAGTRPGRWSSQPRAHAPLAGDGTCELTLSRPGRYRLELRASLLVFSEELELFAGRREWTRRFETARVLIRAPTLEHNAVLRYTAGSGPVEILALLDTWTLRNEGQQVLDLPVGRGRLEKRTGIQVPDLPWTLSREIEVVAGQETVIELP